MPVYEYHCEKCGLNFEVEQRMTDDALSTHDGCGGAVVKVFSSAGIVLKGSGFYKTDTRSGSKKSSTPSGSSSTSSSDKKSDTTASPPAAKESTGGSDSSSSSSGTSSSP